MTKKDKDEINFWHKAIRILEKGYGFCDPITKGRFMSNGRCGSCDATEVKRWIERHISLIKEFQ